MIVGRVVCRADVVRLHQQGAHERVAGDVAQGYRLQILLSGMCKIAQRDISRIVYLSFVNVT